MLRDGASATFNFNGGTYRATDNHTIGSNIVINLQGGGGTIDTNGFNVNSASALLVGAGSGALNKIGAGEFNVPRRHQQHVRHPQHQWRQHRRCR